MEKRYILLYKLILLLQFISFFYFLKIVLIFLQLVQFIYDQIFVLKRNGTNFSLFINKSSFVSPIVSCSSIVQIASLINFSIFKKLCFDFFLDLLFLPLLMNLPALSIFFTISALEILLNIHTYTSIISLNIIS